MVNATEWELESESILKEREELTNQLKEVESQIQIPPKK
ncbi:hypothetical protein GvMRE_IIg307 [endosymbiont GvMRE of Glomus versiforme]|nr:hypothetical protein GvMRE_IIg307 [endosymbiont GvMRE of Glomus versiforme]